MRQKAISTQKLEWPHRNLTRDVPACSTVSLPTATPCFLVHYNEILFKTNNTKTKINYMSQSRLCFYINTCQSITQHFILYTIKRTYCQGDMFRPLLGHLQVLWENRSKRHLYFNAIWDPRLYIFVVYKIKCCVMDWHFVFIRYNTSGWIILKIKKINTFCFI